MSKENKNLHSWPHKNPQFLEEVQGTNKRRDLYILELLADGALQVEVAKELGLDKSRIAQIASINKTFLDKLTFQSRFATKAGRLRLAFRFLAEKASSKKDPIEILDYIRKEIEGDVQFKQQINQFINYSDEALDEIIKDGVKLIKNIENEPQKKGDGDI